MHTFRVDLNACPAELRAGLAEIIKDYPPRFRVSRQSRTVTFVPDPAVGGLTVAKPPSGITVRYRRQTDAFRALGRLLGEQHPAAEKADFSEIPRFDLLGVMVDVSRNGVLLPTAAKNLMRRCALMGINMVILYAEDTYQVPGEPFFGYLRGAYTRAEMQDLDDYAAALGIEMFPCIQTLAHLAQILQWPAYARRCDTDNVLLAEDADTYTLIEKMIAAASAPFRSRRIHVGMDEAHGIGSGRYRAIHGEINPFEILNTHLTRVRDICRRQGLKPMIWSDMYFRLGSKSHNYYDPKCVIPPKVIQRIPKDVELVYWDYYHLDQAFYEDWIDRHRALGSEPLMAGGVWTWNRFWTALPFTMAITRACMQACKRKKLRQVFTTLWGDDGMECDLFSALPGLQYFAEHGYAETVNEQLLRANFRGTCDAVFDDWVKASGVDGADPDQLARYSGNPGKWLLWQDPLLALMDPQIKDHDALSRHHARLGQYLRQAARRSPASRRLLFPAQLARTLALKGVLRRNLAAAYPMKNRARWQRLEQETVQTRRAVATLWQQHRALWLSLYKPFGLEVLERRYGGLLARLDSLAQRVRDYRGSKLDSIPELEVRLEKIYDRSPAELAFTYSRVATPSYEK